MMAPRLSTGFGSNVPGLHRPQYGNMVFPQAGTLPQRLPKALGEYLPDDGGEPARGEASGAADLENVELPSADLAADPPIFEVNVTETVFPWELLLLGGALFFLMDSKKRRTHGKR